MPNHATPMPFSVIATELQLSAFIRVSSAANIVFLQNATFTENCSERAGN
jgi:hypothetical protein